MTEEEKELQEAEEDFKRNFFESLLKAGIIASIDEDGFILVPRQRHKPTNADDA